MKILLFNRKLNIEIGRSTKMYLHITFLFCDL